MGKLPYSKNREVILDETFVVLGDERHVKHPDDHLGLFPTVRCANLTENSGLDNRGSSKER